MRFLKLPFQVIFFNCCYHWLMLLSIDGIDCLLSFFDWSLLIGCLFSWLVVFAVNSIRGINIILAHAHESKKTSISVAHFTNAQLHPLQQECHKCHTLCRFVLKHWQCLQWCQHHLMGEYVEIYNMSWSILGITENL